MQIDLRRFGYQLPKGLAYQATYLSMANKLIFAGNSTVAVSLVAQNPRSGLSVRGKQFGSPYVFRTIFLDATSGSELRGKTWSNASSGSGIFPLPDGNLIVSHGLELELRTSGGGTIKNLALNPNDFPRAAEIRLSPSGHTLWADPVVAPGDRLLRVRATDLTPLGWVACPQGFARAVFDSWVAILRSVSGTSTPLKDDWLAGPSEVLAARVQGVGEPGAPAKRIFLSSTPGCYSVAPIEDNRVALSGQCHSLIVFDAGAKVLYARHFGNELTGPVSACRECDLLALQVYVLKGGFWFDTFPKAKPLGIAVVNWPADKLVYLPDGRETKYGRPIAFSPDGCLLAVQRDWELDVYRICGSAIGAALGFTPTPGRVPGRGSPLGVPESPRTPGK